MNIIIIGCGKIGATIAEQLNNEGHRITIIDQNERVLRNIANKLDVLGINGNGAVMEVQREAGVENADILIAVTGSDEVNMLCCLIAKKNANLSTIARIRNPEYENEIEYLRKMLSISMVINPEKMAASEIVRLLEFPFAIEIDSFSRGRVDLIKIRLGEDAPILGIPLQELQKRASVIPLICVIERGNEVIIPRGSTCLQANDMISFIAKPQEAVTFARECRIPFEPNRSIFLIGGSRIAYYTAGMMNVPKHRFQLKLIEQNAERCTDFANRFENMTVINGDGSDQQLLIEEGIEKADAFVALTGIDEENIIMSMFAAKRSVPRRITKINRLDPTVVSEEMNVGSVVSTRMYTSDYVLRFVRGLERTRGVDIEALYTVANGKAEAAEFLVKENNPAYVGIPFAQLKLRKNVLVAAIFRGNEIIRPAGADYMQLNDRVVIITTDRGLHGLEDVLI
ncbi:MAG: Trk system potassium transporter TrkA [Lachnospiraceae bacterium]|nr:Trk system potassium transporter TrkA [Lachnospiraceae bacterium]